MADTLRAGRPALPPTRFSNEPTRKLLSVVVPVFNEEENVEPLYEAVQPVFAALADRYDYELIFTDNHSTDATSQKLEQLAARDPRVRVLRFSRNFGYQRSIFTGYLNARGHAAIQLDCDLQDPPAMILDFVREWEAGSAVVYGIRRSRQEAWWINKIRAVFYRVIAALSSDPLPIDAGDFRLVDRRILDELRKLDDYRPYIRGTIAALGFTQTGIPYDRAGRTRGETHFAWKDMIGLAIDGVLNHSIVPLRVASYTGLVISILTSLGIVVFVVGRLVFGQDWPRGFTTLAVLVLLSLSLNAIFLGIIGEYLGRIYQQVKKRPITVVEREWNTRATTGIGHE